MLTSTTAAAHASTNGMLKRSTSLLCTCMRAQSLENKPSGVRFLVGHKICLTHILASPSIDTKGAPSIDSLLSPQHSSREAEECYTLQ
ncbi:hypothetical protein F2Q69_00046230 [Brassica cretica]|uniref:Uncharacterized protein n=1 Tax=Brassica cretica TaxID=69181 RepID=A0A8S9PEV8_BRACR|nr:hypothetical protein F2Q69_00046230 [Brassica cretica]